MENNNNNGRGIFYGVIGVATLVVAIIGATFAYFSASVAGANNVTAGTSNITLEWNNQVITGLKSDLIPIDTDAIGKKWENETTEVNQAGDELDYTAAFARAAGIDATKCKDNAGNSICSVFQFTIKNPSTTTKQTVWGHLNNATATTMGDLYFAMFVGEASKIYDANSMGTTTGFNVHGTSAEAESLIPTGNTSNKGGLIQGATLVSSLKQGQSSDTEATKWTRIENSRKILAPGESVTYTIILWLEESYSSQETQEGQSWAGNIMFNTGSGTGVTGQLTVVG